jgi:hypothetical protein
MKIKLSMPSQPHPTDLSQFTGSEGGYFSGCEFHANDGIKEADAWFVFDDVDIADDECIVPPNQVHFLTAETSYRDDRWFEPWVLAFLKQFSHIHSCHPINLPNATFSPPFLPWMINANHNSIFSPHERDLSYFRATDAHSKDFPMSIFCSEKAFTPSHHLRLKFAEEVEKHFRGDVHWFGNGIRPLTEKWSGLAPYLRSIVLENRSDYGVYSEKVLDPFLALTQPIYWGAPDIASYLPVAPSLQLNIRDIRGSIAQLEKAINKPLTLEDQKNLVIGKNRVIGDLHFLERIAKIARRFSDNSELSNPVEIRLSPERLYAPAAPAQKRSVEDKIYMLGKRILSKKKGDDPLT